MSQQNIKVLHEKRELIDSYIQIKLIAHKAGLGYTGKFFSPEAGIVPFKCPPALLNEEAVLKDLRVNFPRVIDAVMRRIKKNKPPKNKPQSDGYEFRGKGKVLRTEVDGEAKEVDFKHSKKEGT